MLGADARRLAVFSSSLAVFLFVACLALARELRIRRFHLENPQFALEDDRVRAALIAELASKTPGIYDSHPDADITRVLVPGRSSPAAKSGVSTNRMGVREKEYVLPKPRDTVRVVFLGDSYVFGKGVAANDRMGAFLDRYLRERRTNEEVELECLHLGVPSWNVVSESSFLRRQLSECQPDLVVHLVVQNDLDDTAGVRGFGAMADHSPQTRNRTGERVLRRYPGRMVSKPITNYLLLGADLESRERYEEAVRQIARLAEAVEDLGGKYLLAVHWPHFKTIFRSFVEPALSEDQLLFLPRGFSSNPDMWISSGDQHWNAEGNAAFARLIYGVVRSRDLLPVLELAEWPGVEAMSRAWVSEGREEARTVDRDVTRQMRRVASNLSFSDPRRLELRQIYCGVDQRGNVSQYASLVLRGGGSLRIQGERLGRRELDGAVLTVRVEGRHVASIGLAGDGPVDEVFPLPADLRDRRFLNVRLESDDWTLAGPELRECVSFVLTSISFE